MFERGILSSSFVQEVLLLAKSSEYLASKCHWYLVNFFEILKVNIYGIWIRGILNFLFLNSMWKNTERVIFSEVMN